MVWLALRDPVDRVASKVLVACRETVVFMVETVRRERKGDLAQKESEV